MNLVSAPLAHALCAVIWFFLSSEPSIASFTMGTLVGFLLLLVFREFFGARAYLRRWHGLIRFGGRFALAFARANATIAWAVLTRDRDAIHPGIVEYDIAHLGPWEVFLLAQSISLTPGSTTILITPDRSTLLVHAFEARDPEAVRRDIHEELEIPLLAFTR